MEKLAEKWGAKAVAALVSVWQKEEGRKVGFGFFVSFQKYL